MLNNQKGVTLLELLISITLLAILLVPLSNLFLLSFQTTGATKVQLSDRAIAVDVIEGLKDAVRSNVSSFSYGDNNKVFLVCSGTCSDVTFKVNGKEYTATYKINTNFKTELASNGIAIPAANQLIKIDVTLKPTYLPQGSEDIDYSVIVARKTS